MVVADSTTELTRWVAGRREHVPNVAAVSVLRTEAQSLATVAAHLLTGLGKRPDLTVLKRPAEHVAAAWLTTTAVTDVFVLNAQKISGWLVPELTVWLTGLGVSPWLIYTTTERTAAELQGVATDVAAEWGVAVETEADLRRAFPDARIVKKVTVSARPSGLPVLPRCDGLVFRTHVRELLPAAQARKVDALFVRAVQQIRTEVAAALETSTDRRRGRVVAGVVWPHLRVTRDVEEMVLWARAAQVACLPLGWLLDINTVLLVAAAELRPRVGVTHASGIWKRLAEYREPDFGAVAGLHASGFDVGRLDQLTVATIPTDASAPIFLPDGVQLIDEAAVFLRVLAAYRRSCGAEGSEPLFASHRGGVDAKTAHSLLLTIERELGDTPADRTAGRRGDSGKEALQRHGIRIVQITGKGRSGP